MDRVAIYSSMERKFPESGRHCQWLFDMSLLDTDSSAAWEQSLRQNDWGLFMTVQELFQIADMEKTVDAYLLMYAPSYDDERVSAREKLDRWLRLKSAVRENCRLFRDCAAEKAEEPETIFILELESPSWEERGQREFECFSVKDREASEKARRNFTVWNREGDCRIEHYVIDMTPMKTLAGYSIAGNSVKEYGAELCCATVLDELFWDGYTEESRKENVGRIRTELEERVRKMEDHPESLIPAEKVYGELRQNIMGECEDEDERQHMMMEHTYEKSVEEIEMRHAAKILERNHQKVIGAIREEYGNFDFQLRDE